METLNQQMIRIAKEHGHRAEFNLSGGVDVFVAWIKPETRETGFEKFSVNNLKQLRDALGY
jgi:hypothetical protein